MPYFVYVATYLWDKLHKSIIAGSKDTYNCNLTNLSHLPSSGIVKLTLSPVKKKNIYIFPHSLANIVFDQF